VGPILSLVGAIWSLVAGVIAVRQALDFDTGKAIVTCVIGWIVVMILGLVLAAIGIGGAAALGALSS
jgi:hypothetical protein